MGIEVSLLSYTSCRSISLHRNIHYYATERSKDDNSKFSNIVFCNSLVDNFAYHHNRHLVRISLLSILLSYYWERYYPYI